LKEGPPDWDEFTVTDDLPKRALLEELPLSPTKPRPEAAGGPLAAAIVGVWCVLILVVIAIIEAAVHRPKNQQAYVGLAIAGLVLGLAVALRAVDRVRRTGDSRGGHPNLEA